jgi:hypothetical protein
VGEGDRTRRGAASRPTEKQDDVQIRVADPDQDPYSFELQDPEPSFKIALLF